VLGQTETEFQFNQFYPVVQKHLVDWLSEGDSIFELLRTLDSQSETLRKELIAKSADTQSIEFKDALLKLNCIVDWVGLLWRFPGYCNPTTTEQQKEKLREFRELLKQTMIRYTFNHLEHLQYKEPS